MTDAALDDPPDDLTDIVVPKHTDPFPPFGVSAAAVEPPIVDEEGWAFADSFELAMLAVCLAGASFLAATLFGADPIGGLLAAQPAAQPAAMQAQTVLTAFAAVCLLVGIVFAVEGLFRLRALIRLETRPGSLTRPASATPACACAAAPGARTGRSPARSRAWARRRTPGS